MSRKNKDITERLLEEFNDVFADIMNVYLFHGKQVTDPDALEDVMPVFAYKAEDGMHEEERDIAKYWKSGGVIIAMAGLENQTDEDPHMVFRIIGYDGAAYRAQLLHGNPGYPVITIILYYGSHHWKGSVFLKDHLRIPEELKKYVSDYRINVFEVSFLSEEEISRFRSDFRYVADYFAKIRTDPDYRGSDAELTHVDAVMKLLSAITGKPYDGKAREKVKKGEIRTMKNAINEIIDKAEDKARAEGKAEGREEGKAEGKAEGIAEGRNEGEHNRSVKTAEALIKDGFSDEKVMQYSFLSKDDVKAVRRKMQLQFK